MDSIKKQKQFFNKNIIYIFMLKGLDSW